MEGTGGIVNRDAYNEAWANLLAARRRESLPEIGTLAEKLAHEVKLLTIEQDKKQQETCNHFLVLNGICIECGHQKLDTSVDS